jgi:hypothetical protein
VLFVVVVAVPVSPVRLLRSTWALGFTCPTAVFLLSLLAWLGLALLELPRRPVV